VVTMGVHRQWELQSLRLAAQATICALRHWVMDVVRTEWDVVSATAIQQK
jgi:hypothetical protein